MRKFWRWLFPSRRPATLAELLAKKYPTDFARRAIQYLDKYKD